MRRQREMAQPEPAERSDLRIALVVAPFVLLAVVLLAVKTADSATSFRIDDRAALDNLRQRISEAAGSRHVDDEAELMAVASGERLKASGADLREVHET